MKEYVKAAVSKPLKQPKDGKKVKAIDYTTNKMSEMNNLGVKLTV